MGVPALKNINIYMEGKIMSDENKHNLFYFKNKSMKGLYETMEDWQRSNKKRLLSTNIQKDGGEFCCIALSNPTEVVILSGSKYAYDQAMVVSGKLHVTSR